MRLADPRLLLCSLSEAGCRDSIARRVRVRAGSLGYSDRNGSRGLRLRGRSSVGAWRLLDLQRRAAQYAVPAETAAAPIRVSGKFERRHGEYVRRGRPPLYL